MHFIPSGAKMFLDKIAQTTQMRKAFCRRAALCALFLLGAAAVMSLGAPINAAFNRRIADAWNDGWLCWKAGDEAGAYSRWSSAEALIPFSQRAARFYYWRIRALEKMGRRSEASALASLLALRQPLSFYTFALSYTGRYPALSAAAKNAADDAPYRRRWEKEVKAAAAATGISKNVLWALIMQESKFDAGAVSRNGAVGLMQLMPFTAREAAARLKNEQLSPYLPTHNIMLGSSHLLHLKKPSAGTQLLPRRPITRGPRRSTGGAATEAPNG